MRITIGFFVITFCCLCCFHLEAQVVQEWAQNFTSAGNNHETVNDMFVDQQGNVFVTGSQKGFTLSQSEALTVKYNSQGVQQWIQNYIAPNNNGAFGRAIHVDAAGNVYVTGENAIISGGANEMLVIKYNSGGTQLWSYRFQYVQNFYCGGFDIITDASGNVYVTGEYGNGGNNIFLAKFNSNGALVGQTFYNVESEGGRKIAMNGAGKIIVAGYCSLNQTDSTRFIALTYEQNLDLLWATRFGSKGTGNPMQSVNDMVIDINSNIVVTGVNNLNYAVFKLNPDGTLSWNKFYSSSYDIPRGLVTDNTGNIYVTGETGVLGLPLTYAITTIKYDPAGNEQWIRNYNGGYTPDGYSGYDIAIDNSSNIYITGNVYSTSDIATLKYNTNGSLQWAKTFNGPGNNIDNSVVIGVDGSGNTYVSGNSFDLTTGNDISTIKYSPVSLFANEFKKNSLTKSITDLQSAFDTISVDYTAPVNYYVYDVNLKIDSVLHSNTGDLEFYLIHNGITDTAIYQVGGTGDNFIGTILNDSATNPISGGTAPFNGTFKPSRVLSAFNNSNINGTWILKIYDRASGNTGTLKAWSLNFVVGINPIGINNISTEIPASYTLSQNYPNPFNPVTNIKFAIPASGFVKLIVFDMLGRQVETLVNDNLTAGTYNADWDASMYSSGVYFYKLESIEYTDVKKMILVK